MERHKPTPFMDWFRSLSTDPRSDAQTFMEFNAPPEEEEISDPYSDEAFEKENGV
jgi:hypothetical protein